jgi:hypothetical protein
LLSFEDNETKKEKNDTKYKLSKYGPRIKKKRGEKI